MNFFSSLQQSLSAPRLDGYRRPGGGDHEALGRYLWNLALCESLYPVFQTLEIAFRNRVHGEIAATVAGSEWLRAEIGFLAPFELERIQQAKGSLRAAGKVVSEPSLIAELSFGFWTSLLDVRYDRVWHKIISGVFSQMPRSIRTRAEASARMSAVRRLRNAALHHHSIWHWSDLGQKHEHGLLLISWLCPASAKMVGAVNRFPAVFREGAGEFSALVHQLLD